MEKLLWEDIIEKKMTFLELLDSGSEVYCMLTNASTFLGQEDIEKMGEAISQNEHFVFAFPGRIEAENEYEIANIDRDAVLINKNKLLSCIGDYGRETVTPLSICDLSEWIKGYGLLTIKVDVSSLNGVNGVVLPQVGKLIDFYEEDKNQKTILFVLEGAYNRINGSYVHLVGLLDGLLVNLPSDFSIEICTIGNVRNYKMLKERYNSINFVPLELLDRVYDFGFIYSHTSTFLIQSILDAYCVKWLTWPLDLIAYRSGISDKLGRMGLRSVVKYADGIVFSTNAVRRDFETCFVGEKNLHFCNKIISYLPGETFRNIDTEEEMAKKCPFDTFVLVFGNSNFKHKMIRPCVESLKNYKRNIVVVGWHCEEYINEHIYAYPSGWLEQDYIDYLFQNCECFVFPSMDEGFGLPVVHALNCGKEVVVQDNWINHELKNLHREFPKHYHFFDVFSHLGECIDEAIRDTKDYEKNLYNKTWDDVGAEVASLIQEVDRKKIDTNKLLRRYNEYKECGNVQKIMLIDLISKMITSFDVNELNNSKEVDVYGLGNNGKAFAKIIKDKVKIGCFIDSAPKVLEWNNIPVVSKENYANDNRTIIIVPVYDFNSIKQDLVIRCKVEEENVVSIIDYLM